MKASGTSSDEFDAYIGRLTTVIGHKDRHEPLQKYCIGLVLPEGRKSVEPMAARISPSRVSAEHQSLLHFVGQSTWRDEAVLREALAYALPHMKQHGRIEAWIVDDSGLPKKGRHSVGVANQYCGVLGKNHNCQVAVSISLANETASIPAAHRLYLPKGWANDLERRTRSGVPEEVRFLRKWEIALELVDELLARPGDTPPGTVLADPAYGDCFEFRTGLRTRGLLYALGVSSTLKVWRPGDAPLPAEPYRGRGRRPQRVRRTADHQPVAAVALAKELLPEAWRTVTWREGTAGGMTSRFAALRVRPAHRDFWASEAHPEEWLLIEWPESEAEPTKYWLSTEPANLSLDQLVRRAKLRWRIERDYQDLKQRVGFGHYEGRGWRGFHHHFTLCIAAYAFLVAERARLSPPHAAGVPALDIPPLPESYRPRGSPDPGGATSTDLDPLDERTPGR